MKNKTNPPTKDYYNRPYKLIIAGTIAVLIVWVMGWSILKLVEKVSDDNNDFDYTYIPYQIEHKREISINMERCRI